jgi:hypothetical protein
MYILKSIFILQQALNSIKVVSSPCVHNDTWRLIDDNKIFRFTDNLDRKIQHGRLDSYRCMNDLISVCQNVTQIRFLIVYCDQPLFDSILVIFSRICFKLLNESGIKLLADPSTLRESTIDVGIRLHKSEWINMEVVRSLLLWLVLLHSNCGIIYIIVVM